MKGKADVASVYKLLLTVCGYLLIAVGWFINNNYLEVIKRIEKVEARAEQLAERYSILLERSIATSEKVLSLEKRYESRRNPLN